MSTCWLRFRSVWVALVVSGGCLAPAVAAPSLVKVADLPVYRDERFHCAFPSVVRRPDGELLVAFRRAPDRRRFGEKSFWHADPNSLPILIRSRDEGRTWSRPETIYAHPFGGSQDPCMVQLSDGSLVLTSYAWAWMTPETLPLLRGPVSVNLGKFVFLGGYVLRSTDGGASWGEPIVPPAVPAEVCLDIFGQRVPAYNRGAMTEGRDGRLYWVVAANAATKPWRHETHLLVSADRGASWSYACPVARDEKVTFNETSLYETPKGDLVAFLRTGRFDDHLALARSTDGGKSFGPWQDAGIQGHPFHALRLPDGRVLLVYGYRHPPYGIRARVIDAECRDIAAAPEVVLRDDGGTIDLGYPWATLLAENRALVVYYFNRGDGPRTIEATLVEFR